MNKKEISKFSGAGAFIVVPETENAVVTQRDQSRLGALQTWKHAKFAAVHFLAASREKVLARVKAAKLSKPMRVIEITEAQWSRRFKESEETIAGTGIKATAAQLSRAFFVCKD